MVRNVHKSNADSVLVLDFETGSKHTPDSASNTSYALHGASVRAVAICVCHGRLHVYIIVSLVSIVSAYVRNSEQF